MEGTLIQFCWRENATWNLSGGNAVLFLSGKQCWLGCFGKGMLVGERSLVWIVQEENASWDPLGEEMLVQ